MYPRGNRPAGAARLLLAAALASLGGCGATTTVAISRPSDALVGELRRAVLGGGACTREEWREPGPLTAEVFLGRPDGSLIFFAQVPDYFCRSSNTAVPVLVEPEGKWRWGEPLAGMFTRVLAAADGTLVAATQWQIEGTYPALLTSRDGLTWIELELPEDRATRAPDETAEICLGEWLEVRLRSEIEGKAELWTRALGDADWKRLDEPGCAAAAGQPGGWSRTETTGETRFERGLRAVVVPRTLSP